MGTRNLTCVVQNGEYKIAKYGQWDGYLGSLGADILTFLRDEFKREPFLTGLSKVKEVTTVQLKQFWVDAGADPKCDFVTFEVAEKFNKVHPELGRDLSGANLLRSIQAGTVLWSRPDLNFAADSLFCEWCYVLDLDKNTFESYEGFNTTPIPAGERFASLSPKKYSGDDSNYYPVRLLKSYKLNRLPSNKTLLRLRTFSKQKEAAAKKTKTLVTA